MDGTAKLLEQIRQAARKAADIELTDASWGTSGLRDLVIDVLEQCGRTPSAIGTPGAQAWSSMTWSDTDAPVVLARALEVAHGRLSVAAREGRTDNLATTGGPQPGTIASPLENVAAAAGCRASTPVPGARLVGAPRLR